MRPRLGAGYVLFGLALVFFALVGVPIGMCGVSGCYFSPGVVASIMASVLGTGALLVVIGALLLITTGGTRASSRDDAMPSVRDCGPIFVRVLRELPAATPPSDLRGKDRAVAEDPNYGKAASAMTYRGGAIVYEPFREGYGGGRASTPGIARLITRKGQAQTDPVQSAANGSFGTQITYSPW